MTNLENFVTRNMQHVQRHAHSPVIQQNFNELGLKAIKLDILAKKFRGMADNSDLPDSVKNQLALDAEVAELTMNEILATMDRVLAELRAS